MVRDKEIERLKKYAEGLGVKVKFSNSKKKDAAADFTLDGTEITVYARMQTSKTDTILSLLHEIGHLLDHIHRTNREVDSKVEEAIDSSDKDVASKYERKRILNFEIAGTEYWDTIYKETNLKIPYWKLQAAKEHDIWQYEIYYETGYFPSANSAMKKYREICKRHKEVDYG